MKTYSFKVVLEPDEDAAGAPAWFAYCPALERIGGATSGRTREEALQNINQVIRMIVQEFVEDGKPLPGLKITNHGENDLNTTGEFATIIACSQ